MKERKNYVKPKAIIFFILVLFAESFVFVECWLFLLILIVCQILPRMFFFSCTTQEKTMKKRFPRASRVQRIFPFPLPICIWANISYLIRRFSRFHEDVFPGPGNGKEIRIIWVFPRFDDHLMIIKRRLTANISRCLTASTDLRRCKWISESWRFCPKAVAVEPDHE